MKGRKSAPTRLRILRGNPSKRPLPKNEPKPSPVLPKPPAYLSVNARKIFAELVATLDEIGLASRSHTRELALCAARLADVEHYEAVLVEAGGHFYKAKGVICTHPAVRMRHDAARHAQALLESFGLSPSASTKVAAVPRVEKAANRFAGTL